MRRQNSQLLALLVPCLWVCVHCEARAQSHAERAALAGELVTLKHHKVLRLFGSEDRERGFAHGYLLAEQVLECLDDALQSLPQFTVEKFETRLLPWATRRLVWDAGAVQELDGLFEGLQARLGEKGLIAPALGRAITRDDLFAINAVADWFGPACSAFSACGTKTEAGQVIHGRNLDFPLGPRAIGRQVILAQAALPARGKPGAPDARAARKAWAGVGWPGLICVFSAMNADGLVCCLHDATNVIKGGEHEGFIARGLLLRRILESLDPAAGDPAAAAAKLAAVRPAACGNLFHLSWPKLAAEKWQLKPSAALEFDGSGREPNGTPVNIRRMDDSDALVLTNHYCVRRPAVECERFSKISAGILAFSKNGTRIDLAAARQILIGGEQQPPLATTAHTLVFFPDRRGLLVALTRGNIQSTRVVGAEFEFEELQGNAKGGVEKR